MCKDKAEAPTGKGGRMNKLLLIAGGGAVLCGAGAGAGIYMGGGLAAEAPRPEDRFPKLVLRSKSGDEAPAAGNSHEAPPPKVGTVSVPNDRFKVDPGKYEITYVPIEQAFTTNLADGSGFLQVGISLSTYYDGRMVANVQRQKIGRAHV